MRRLCAEQRTLLLKLLVEGNSIRGIERITGISKTTIAKFIKDFGEFSKKVLDKYVTDLEIKRLQMDEVHSFVASRSRNTHPEDRDIAGTQWIWVAMCPDTKLVISFYVGDREVGTATKFSHDVAKRIKTRPIQISTDGLKAYIDAIDSSFGTDVHYGMLVKNFTKDAANNNQEVPVTLKRRVVGNPDPAHISTSYLERQNLTMRMSNRRLIRRSNGHSKKMEYHIHALYIHYLIYNFVRIHQTLRMTPAMAAGIVDELFEFEDMVYCFEEYEIFKQWWKYQDRSFEKLKNQKTCCGSSLPCISPDDYAGYIKRKRRNAARKTASAI